MSAHAVAVTLVNRWFSRFGLPDVVTTDQGRQFEANLFRSLSETFGIQHVHTSPYHPQANGVVERPHKALKHALTTQESTHWSTKLPLILLALRSTVKSDIVLAPAEMVYSTTLRLLGELFHPAPPELIATLRDAMVQLRPTPGTNHETVNIRAKGLSNVSHVFLRIDAVKPPLQPRYKGPHAVLERREKKFKLQCHNRQVWVSVDRLKRAFVLCENPSLTDHSYAVNTISKKQVRFLLPGGSSVVTHNQCFVTAVSARQPPQAARPSF